MLKSEAVYEEHAMEQQSEQQTLQEDTEQDTSQQVTMLEQDGTVQQDIAALSEQHDTAVQPLQDITVQDTLQQDIAIQPQRDTTTQGTLQQDAAMQSLQDTMQSEQDTLQQDIAIQPQQDTTTQGTLQQDAAMQSPQDTAVQSEQDTLQQVDVAMQPQQDILQQNIAMQQNSQDTAVQSEQDTLQQDDVAMQPQQDTLQQNIAIQQDSQDTAAQSEQDVAMQSLQDTEQDTAVQSEQDTLQQDTTLQAWQDVALQPQQDTAMQSEQDTLQQDAALQPWQDAAIQPQQDTAVPYEQDTLQQDSTVHTDHHLQWQDTAFAVHTNQGTAWSDQQQNTVHQDTAVEYKPDITVQSEQTDAQTDAKQQEYGVFQQDTVQSKDIMRQDTTVQSSSSIPQFTVQAALSATLQSEQREDTAQDSRTALPSKQVTTMLSEPAILLHYQRMEDEECISQTSQQGATNHVPELESYTVNWAQPVNLGSYCVEGREEHLCPTVSDDEIDADELDAGEPDELDMDELVPPAGHSEGGKCKESPVELASISPPHCKRREYIKKLSQNQDEELAPLMKRRKMLCGDETSTPKRSAAHTSEKAIQVPSDEELADNGYETVFQALPTECARQHALVPNVPPCRLSADEEAHHDDGGAGPPDDDGAGWAIQIAEEKHLDHSPSPSRHIPPQTEIAKSPNFDNQLVPEDAWNHPDANQTLYSDNVDKKLLHLEVPDMDHTDTRRTPSENANLEQVIPCLPSIQPLPTVTYPRCFEGPAQTKHQIKGIYTSIVGCYILLLHAAIMHHFV